MTTKPVLWSQIINRKNIVKKLEWQFLANNESYPEHKNGNTHNEKCKINSQSCSLKMSDVFQDLCFWHYKRMGGKIYIECKCKQKFTAVDGDSIGRSLARDYHEMDYSNTPVFCLGNLYCCGYCSNTDSEKYYCGDMLVGDCCAYKHSNLKNL